MRALPPTTCFLDNLTIRIHTLCSLRKKKKKPGVLLTLTTYARSTNQEIAHVEVCMRESSYGVHWLANLPWLLTSHHLTYGLLYFRSASMGGGTRSSPCRLYCWFYRVLESDEVDPPFLWTDPKKCWRVSVCASKEERQKVNQSAMETNRETNITSRKSNDTINIIKQQYTQNGCICEQSKFDTLLYSLMLSGRFFVFAIAILFRRLPDGKK